MADSKGAPRALKVIAALQYVAAIFMIGTGLVVASESALTPAVFVVAGVVFGVLSFGLLRANSAARTITIVVQSLAFVQAVYAVVNGFVQLNLILAPAIVGTLLWDRSIRDWFGQQPSSSETIPEPD